MAYEFGNCDWFVLGNSPYNNKRCTVASYSWKRFYNLQVKELDKHEALELFNQHAFRGNKLKEDYFELAKEAGVWNLNLYGV